MADIVPGTLEMLVLKTLAAGPEHGFGIARRIGEASGGGILVEEGSLYPALYRMEARGWIAADWGESENNRRAKFYRLRPKGSRRLAVEVREWERASEAIRRVLSPGASAAVVGG
jgi:PadR family transcriptional regulator PadR